MKGLFLERRKKIKYSYQKVYIENKYSLCIHFKKEYEEYAKKTPAYMNQELWLFAIFYLVIIVTNICLTTTIYI